MKWLLLGLTGILWSLALGYTITGSIFMAWGLYGWSIVFLPVFIFVVALFGAISVGSTFMLFTVWSEE